VCSTFSQDLDRPLFSLIIEIKGYRKDNAAEAMPKIRKAKDKKATMETYWIPWVNALTSFGRWAFGELTDLYDIETGLDRLIQERLGLP